MLRAHWDSWKSWGHLHSRSPSSVGYAVKTVLHAVQEEGITYNVRETQAPGSRGTGLWTQSQITGCSSSAGTSQWPRAVHYGDMQLTHPTQSKCSFCFFNVTMFISFQLPLCKLGQLNLSNFPGGSHSKSLLRVSSSDRSVLDWIHEKTATLRQVGSCHPTTQKTHSSLKSRLSIRCMSAWFTDLCALGHVQLFVIPRAVVHHESMRFSRQEYWDGLPFPPPWDLPHPRIEHMSPASLAGRFFYNQATCEDLTFCSHPQKDGTLWRRRRHCRLMKIRIQEYNADLRISDTNGDEIQAMQRFR